MIWNGFAYMGLRSNTGRLRLCRFSWSALMLPRYSHISLKGGGVIGSVVFRCEVLLSVLCPNMV